MHIILYQLVYKVHSQKKKKKIVYKVNIHMEFKKKLIYTCHVNFDMLKVKITCVIELLFAWSVVELH